ncbi:hypothetical protein [uncultured Devosia sp.]|uniref:hypothetical protein n=1 Tax=uncultured Devosia sp. TaxID=211434 RepID=UPI0035CAF8B2
MLPIAIVLAALAATPASAQTNASARCAEDLNADALAIFEASAPAIAEGRELQAVVTGTARQLVMSGKIDMSAAPDNAVKAGQCLRLL